MKWLISLTAWHFDHQSEHEHGDKHAAQGKKLFHGMWKSTFGPTYGGWRSSAVRTYSICAGGTLTDMVKVKNGHTLRFKSTHKDAQDIFKVGWWRTLTIYVRWVNFPRVTGRSAAQQVTNNHRARMNTRELLGEKESSSNCVYKPNVNQKGLNRGRLIVRLACRDSNNEGETDTVRVKWRTGQWIPTSADPEAEVPGIWKMKALNSHVTGEKMATILVFAFNLSPADFFLGSLSHCPAADCLSFSEPFPPSFYLIDSLFRAPSPPPPVFTSCPVQSVLDKWKPIKKISR